MQITVLKLYKYVCIYTFLFIYHIYIYIHIYMFIYLFLQSFCLGSTPAQDEHKTILLHQETWHTCEMIDSISICHLFHATYLLSASPVSCSTSILFLRSLKLPCGRYGSPAIWLSGQGAVKRSLNRLFNGLITTTVCGWTEKRANAAQPSPFAPTTG